MIYSKGDVLRMLGKIDEMVEKSSFYYKNDNIPPKVVMIADVRLVLDTIRKLL